MNTQHRIWNGQRLLAAVIAFALLGATACQRGGAASDTMAKVNGKQISRSEVDKYYQSQIAGAPQQPDSAQATSLRLSILSSLIENEIMMQRAEKLGLLATDEEVDAKLAEFKAGFTQEGFDRWLKERNVSLDDFRRDLRRNITEQKVVNREITSKINVSDSEIEQYYNDNKTEFNFIEPQYYLSQILVTSFPDDQVQNRKSDKAQNEAEARKKVQMLLNRLQSGEDFATVAMNYSEHSSTANSGGEMGAVPESAIKNDPIAFEAVNRLKPGQISGIIPVYEMPGKRVMGYRILRLNAREPAGQRDLSDPRVQQHIRQQLRDRREQLLKAAFYEVVRSEADVQNYFARDILKNGAR